MFISPAKNEVRITSEKVKETFCLLIKTKFKAKRITFVAKTVDMEKTSGRKRRKTIE